MFTKNKVSQSMIDAVNKVLGEQPAEQDDVLLNEAGAPIKEPTSTGMKVYGRSYGNSAKAKQDQSKSSVDDLKGPKTKELLQKDKEDYMKTKGKYDEAAKPDYLDFDKDGNKTEPMKKALADKEKVKEELRRGLFEALGTWGNTDRVRLRGAGCPKCHGEGVLRRVAVAEVVLTDAQVMNDILKHGTDTARTNYRKRDDADPSMLESAIRLILEGQADPCQVEIEVDVIMPKEQETEPIGFVDVSQSITNRPALTKRALPGTSAIAHIACERDSKNKIGTV